MSILAIDPGNTESAYVYCSDDLTPLEFGKYPNEKLLEVLPLYPADNTAIEMIASYGMAVGKEVFETCVWIGRFATKLESSGHNVEFVYRKDVKMNLCGSTRAKDGNIRQSLIDRFGTVGVKASKGFFYGFKSDIWSAMAIAVTYHDLRLNKKEGI